MNTRSLLSDMFRVRLHPGEWRIVAAFMAFEIALTATCLCLL